MPLCLGRGGIGAHEQEAPVGHVAHAGPHLLAVDHEVIAVEHRARLEIGQVGARVRLGEALAPELLGGEDARQEAPLLRRACRSFMSVGPSIDTPPRFTICGDSARAISWYRMTISVIAAPRPPNSAGQSMPT